MLAKNLTFIRISWKRAGNYLVHCSSYNVNCYRTYKFYNLRIPKSLGEIKNLNNISRKNIETHLNGALQCCKTSATEKTAILCNQLEKFIQKTVSVLLIEDKLNSKNMGKRRKERKAKLLESPGRMVINYFDQLSTMLGYKWLRVFPILRKEDTFTGYTYWNCEYRLRWPEDRIFSEYDFSKRDALKNSSLAALKFLCDRNVITKHGTPLFSNTWVEPLSFNEVVRRYSTISHKNSDLKKIATTEKIESLKEVEIMDNSNTDGSELSESLLTPKTPNIERIESKNEVEISDNEDIIKLSKLFPNPKNTLGNIFQVIAQEKGSRDYLLSASYKQHKNIWTCTYRIKWPEEKIFLSQGATKKRTSTKCAWQVLEYLLQNKEIDNKGSPIIYDKEDVKVLTKENTPTLYFEKKQMDKLSDIVDFYTQEVFPIIVEPFKEPKVYDQTESEFVESKVKRYSQKFLGSRTYMSKEKIHLPVSDYKEDIIRMVGENRVLIVKGEPGCGKSTRIPQYVLEGWAREAEQTREPCKIVVTEPRRIAAISLAERVASERDEGVGSIVGYQVRLKSNFQQNTGRILYCTNGILLQQFKSDPSLSNYTHIIIDEAHERDVNTDLLLNILRRALKENPNLKVVIMSATIDTELFQDYFEGSSTIHIPGFTYPVKSHFIDNCKLNVEKTLKMCNESKPSVVHEDVVRVLMHLHRKKGEGAILCFLPGWEDIRKIRDLIEPGPDISVLCLHSRLQDSEQWRIFRRAPSGVRKIILSTNIAETSVTIDDVVYVVDTGIHKETTLDVEKGVMCIDNHWISRSSVDQRRGRAGRVQAGESFHMYPRSKMETFPQFSLPEVLRVSLTKVVLDSKAYSQNMNALEFFSQLPSPPSSETVKLAVDELQDLELLDDKEKLTPLGQVLVSFQLEPKLSKTLVNSVVYKCVTPIVDIVTLFSQGTEIFASSLDKRERIRSLKGSFSKTSDHLALMRIFEIYDDFRENGNMRKMEQFCDNLYLVPSRMNNMKALRDVHYDYLHDGLNCKVLPISNDLSDEDEIVKAVLMSGIGNFLSYKNWDIVNGRLKKANVLVTRLNHKATVTPDSVNFKNTSIKSKFLMYINETRSNLRRTTLIRETSLISPIMVLLFSNKKLLLHNITKDQFSPKLKSEDQVLLQLAGTKLNFLLDRTQAITIMQCKMALTSCYDHYVFQLTEGGELNPQLNGSWSELLVKLSDFLNDFKNE